MATAQEYVAAWKQQIDVGFNHEPSIAALRAVIARAILDEREKCADAAHDGGMHHTQEQDVRDAVIKAILARPNPDPPMPRYATIEVSVLGVDVPVEVEFTGEKSDDELYAMAKAQLRAAL